MAGRRWLFSLLIAGVLTLFVSDLAAQGVDCSDGQADLFSVARKSRRMIADYQRLAAIHVDDMERVAELYRSQTGREKPWSAAVAGVVDTNTIYGFDACTNRGEWSADLNPFMVGGILSVDLNTLGIRSEVFGLLVIDRLIASPSEAQMGREPSGVANIREEQFMFGGRLQFRDLASVVAGGIQSGRIQSVVGDDGREMVSGAVDSAAGDRVYLGLGVPRYGAYAHILFDPNDVATDALDLRVSGIPLFYDGLVGRFALRYLEDESQLTLALGVENIAGFLSVDVGFEHRSVNLRHARIRADWSAFTGWDSVELSEMQPGLEAYPRFGFDYGAFAEAAWFQSRHLREQTNHAGVGGCMRDFLCGRISRF